MSAAAAVPGRTRPVLQALDWIVLAAAVVCLVLIVLDLRAGGGGAHQVLPDPPGEEG